MNAFRGNRVVHEFTQTNPATPEKVFPILCPVREDDWLPGWKYRLIYSDSGVAELGCVFTTPNPPGSAAEALASETTWIVTDYDPAAFRIAYLWINPEMVITELVIQLARSGAEETRSHIRYLYTGLSPEGNRELEGYDKEWFEARLRNWEATINYYLKNGRKMAS